MALFHFSLLREQRELRHLNKKKTIKQKDRVNFLKMFYSSQYGLALFLLKTIYIYSPRAGDAQSQTELVMTKKR